VKADQVFQNEIEGIQFVPVYHKYKGKILRVHHPTKSQQEFVKHADSILSSPPKKRAHQDGTTQMKPTVPLQPIEIIGLLTVEPFRLRLLALDPSYNLTILQQLPLHRCRRW
jgi:hypothetical protein